MTWSKGAELAEQWISGILIVAVVCAASVGAGQLLRKGTSGRSTGQGPSPERQITDRPLSLESLPTLGDEKAPVILVEVSDFECPYCRRFAKTILQDIESDYVRKGVVKLAFDYYPLESIHPYALRAAVAAECARRQDMFWPAHSLLFNVSGTDPDQGAAVLSALRGLDSAAFKECLSQDAVLQLIHDRAQTAVSFGITVTPSFLLGYRGQDGNATIVSVISGSQPLRLFRRSIENVRQRAASKSPQG